MHSLSFYIIDENNNTNNNSSKSTLLKKEKELKQLYSYEEDYIHSFVVTDKIIFDKNNQINNFRFILTDSIISSYHITEGGVIGLEFTSNLKSQTDSLFMERILMKLLFPFMKLLLSIKIIFIKILVQNVIMRVVVIKFFLFFLFFFWV